jgi:anti-anti-sigma regulatory factor
MGQNVIIPIDGVFDTQAAAALRKRLADAPPSEQVTLDFSRARDVYDFALAVIAHGLASVGISARYRGLMHHQERMLNYLGFDAGR